MGLPCKLIKRLNTWRNSPVITCSINERGKNQEIKSTSGSDISTGSGSGKVVVIWLIRQSEHVSKPGAPADRVNRGDEAGKPSETTHHGCYTSATFDGWKTD